MLILTRKEGEVVRIGNDIKITVCGIKSGQVKLGFEAPLDVPVHREEIYNKIQGEVTDGTSKEKEG